MLTAAILKSLQIYAISAAVAGIVALLIKALVFATSRVERREPSAVPLGTVCPVGHGVPEEDVAALSAAIYTLIGPHHVLRITHATHGWASGARAAQHSHAPGHK